MTHAGKHAPTLCVKRRCVKDLLLSAFYCLSLRVLYPIAQADLRSVQSCPKMKYLEFSSLPPKQPICYTIMKSGY